MSEQGQWRPPEPPRTNRFGTPLPPSVEQAQPPSAPTWPAPPTQPVGSPYPPPTPAIDTSHPYVNHWAPPAPAQVSVYGAPARARAVWLAPVAGLVALLVVAAGFVGVHRHTPGPGPAERAAAAGLPRVLMDAKPSQISVVTPDSALAVTKAMWPLRTEAVATTNLPLLKQIESGSALAADEAPAECACAAHPDPSFNPSIVVNAPRQAHYPATFLAQVTVQNIGSEPYVQQVLVFQRPSSATPWRVVFESESFDADRPTLPPPSGPGAYAPASPAGDIAKVRRLATALAGQWQQAKDTGRVPKGLDPFEPGYWTDEKDKVLAAHRNGTTQADGLLERYTFSTSADDPVYVASYDDEDVLACTVIHRTVVIMAHPGQHLIQDDARRNFGPQLRPGDYHQVVVQGIAQTCFDTPDPSGLDAVEVFGGDEAAQTISMMGT